MVIRRDRPRTELRSRASQSNPVAEHTKTYLAFSLFFALLPRGRLYTLVFPIFLANAPPRSPGGPKPDGWARPVINERIQSRRDRTAVRRARRTDTRAFAPILGLLQFANSPTRPFISLILLWVAGIFIKPASGQVISVASVVVLCTSILEKIRLVSPRHAPSWTFRSVTRRMKLSENNKYK